jgi:hypothetical protein
MRVLAGFVIGDLRGANAASASRLFAAVHASFAFTAAVSL